MCDETSHVNLFEECGEGRIAKMTKKQRKKVRDGVDQVAKEGDAMKRILRGKGS